MINEKKEIISSVDTLPNDTIYTLYLHSKAQKSKDDIKNGKTMSIEESKEKMKTKYANFDILFNSIK